MTDEPKGPADPAGVVVSLVDAIADRLRAATDAAGGSKLRAATEAKRAKAGAALEARPVVRTLRPYVFDLCDAYNEARTRKDLLWIVGRMGDLRLVDDPDWSANHASAVRREAENERETYKQRSGHYMPPPAPHWQDDEF